MPAPRLAPSVPAPALVAAVALLVIAALLAPLPVGAQSLEDARAERATIQSRLDEAAQQLGDLESRVATLSDEEAALVAEMDELSTRIAEADTRIGVRVRDLYKRGLDTPVMQMMNGTDATDALERAELAHQLLSSDRVVIEEASAARTRASQVEGQLEQRRAALDAARADQESLLADLHDDLERARELEQRLVAEEQARIEAARRAAEEERRRQQAAAAAAAEEDQADEEAPAPSQPAPPPAAAPAPASGGMACPVGQPRSYTDTWGAPRSGGRSHKGTDILAPYGTPVHAIVSGVWDVRSYGGSAGHWAMLRGDDGNTYYYMHLQQHVVGDGARVSAGQQTATNGDTGNARGTPHVHFEVHPGGGGAINPYPTVRAACG